MSNFQTPQSTLTLSNNYSIPCLGYGTWRTDDRTALSAVKIALDTGYRHRYGGRLQKRIRRRRGG